MDARDIIIGASAGRVEAPMGAVMDRGGSPLRAGRPALIPAALCGRNSKPINDFAAATN